MLATHHLPADRDQRVAGVLTGRSADGFKY
jgi:hypothetical protein